MAPKAAPAASSRQTRATTGHSTPRVFAKVEEAVVKPSTKRKTTKKTTTTKAKANTGKPRTKKASTTTGAGVKKAPAKKPAAKKAKAPTKAKVGTSKPVKKPGLIDMVKGAALKVEGAVTGKTGKKASLWPHSFIFRNTKATSPAIAGDLFAPYGVYNTDLLQAAGTAKMRGTK